ncbi:hypothetical protein FWF93_00775 [Candidatus Saccharibacteria bacterium]|nr:hypothetical protein [Candidatus Saccharibacteria bacterium]
MLSLVLLIAGIIFLLVSGGDGGKSMVLSVLLLIVGVSLGLTSLLVEEPKHESIRQIEGSYQFVRVVEYLPHERTFWLSARSESAIVGSEILVLLDDGSYIPLRTDNT